MAKKPIGKSFRRINLAHTDDFGQKNDKIRLWVLNNGGTFSKELNDAVTHLVCSKKAWKEYPDIGNVLCPPPVDLQSLIFCAQSRIGIMYKLALTPSLPVRAARRQRIKIVSLDWLEDSLLSPSRRPKPEKEYEVGCNHIGHEGLLIRYSGRP